VPTPPAVPAGCPHGRKSGALVRPRQADDQLSKFSDGNWPPHYRVPSESELVNQLGFSRMTINRALREMTAEGLLVRMQGVGTFVAEPKTPVGAV
jgi:GntR family transcriptional regulator, histidine utilization repressor